MNMDDILVEDVFQDEEDEDELLLNFEDAEAVGALVVLGVTAGRISNRS